MESSTIGTHPLRILSLFSGYGGFELGLTLVGFSLEVVCYVEIDSYCQRILETRMRDGFLPKGPIWDDIKTFNGRPFAGMADLVVAGFPCQPHSVAGKRRGKDDPRNLWSDTLRVISEVEPRYVLLENVPGIFHTGYGGIVIGELSQAGYDCIWDIISASDIGASHRRERWWCLAYARSKQWDCRGDSTSRSFSPSLWATSQDKPHRANGESRADPRGDDVENTDHNNGRGARSGQSRRTSDDVAKSGLLLGDSPGTGLEGGGLFEAARIQERQRNLTSHRAYNFPPGPDSPEWASMPPKLHHLAPATIECKFCGVANGTPHRVERLKALGNGIVPGVVAEFLWRISAKVL